MPRVPLQRLRIAMIALAVILAGVVVARVIGKPKGDAAPRARQLPSVDVVLAREGTLRGEQEFTGTTRATREVSLRARTEGRLLRLAVDVGDPVQRGQEVARLDDELQRTQLRQAEAELASRQSEVSAAQIQVGEARTRVEQAKLDLVQKQANAKRTRSLYALGYESRQFYEETRTATRIAGQVVRSAEAQVQNAQSAVYSAQSRVSAQRAVIAQERERLSYSVIRSPMDGFVTFRLVQAGDLVSPGGELLRIGDFTLVQVDVEVSELEVRDIRAGQPAAITLDAFEGEQFVGRVDRLSRQADPVSRLVPVTLTLPNPERRIGAGLLARVRFEDTGPPRVVVPETALNVAKPPAGDEKGPVRSQPESTLSSDSRPSTQEGEPATVLVISGEGRAPERAKGGDRKDDPTQKVYTVAARRVRVTARSDGQAEIEEGLAPGERVVSRSSRPLTEGDEVQPSMLSAEALSAMPPAPSSPQGQSRLQAPALPGSGTGPKSAGDPGSGRAGAGPTRSGGSAGGGGGSGRPLFGPISPNSGYGTNYNGDPGRPFTGRTTLPAPPSGGSGGGRPGFGGRTGLGTGTGVGGNGVGGRAGGGTGTGGNNFGGRSPGGFGTGSGSFGGNGSGSTGTGVGAGR